MAFDGESFDGSEHYSERGGDPSGYRALLEQVRQKRLQQIDAERERLSVLTQGVAKRTETGFHDDMDKALEITKLQDQIKELDVERYLIELSGKDLEEEEEDPSNHLVTVTLSAFAWGQILEGLAHLVNLRGSFFSQSMAAELWDLIAAQVNGKPIKIHRWWNDLPVEEEPEPAPRKKVLGIF